MYLANEDSKLNSLVDLIATKYSPEKIILFGSRARGDHRKDSDYDILVIMKKLDNWYKFTTLLYSELIPNDQIKNVDFLVISSDEYEDVKTDVGMVYITIDKEGKVLYENK